MKTTAAHPSTPPRDTNTQGSSSARASFFTLALIMSGQLVGAVFLPILAGVALDKHFNSGTLYTIIGLVVALVGSAVVIGRAAKLANSYPVPKISDAQRSAIKKSYEEDDD